MKGKECREDTVRNKEDRQIIREEEQERTKGEIKEQN